MLLINKNMKNTPKLSRLAHPLFSLRYFVNVSLFSVVCLSLAVVHPPTVFAQITQVPLTLSREQNESYANFVQRATKLTVTQLKNRFSQNSNLNQVRIVLIGENNGVVAPVLSVNMSRQQWLSKLNPESLINYFQDSQFLLGFDTPTTSKPEKSPTPLTTPSGNGSNPTAPTTAPPANRPNSAKDNNSPLSTPPSIPNASTPSPAPIPPTDSAPSANPTQTNPANSLMNRFRQTTPSQSP